MNMFDNTDKRNLAGVKRSLTLALAAIVAACALTFVAPVPACALETAKCTAKPNASGSSDVFGGSETRITWEGQADSSEQVKSVTLTLPEGTSFGTDDARVTLLSGADLMDRERPSVEVSANGQALTFDLDEAATAGSYIRLEVYKVKFPTAGGEEKIQASYELADGSTKELSDVPSITVTGVSMWDGAATWLKQQDWVKKWNENTFLRLFLNPPILVSSIPSVFQGFLMALAIVLVAFPFAIPFGFILALMRISHSRVLRGVASFYVNIIRGTPAFLQIYIAFFGLPLAGVKIPSYPLGVIVLAMNSAAYLCEIFRAGIQSISKGQNEAARSLGMTAAQTMIYVIIPQTFRNVLPTMTSEFILLYKDTSLLAAVGVMEVVMYSKTIVASTGSITPYIVAALFYLVVTIPLARVVSMLESRMLGTDAGKRRKKTLKEAGVIDGDHIA